MTKTTIQWLTPDKPKNISIGRERIAAGLRQRGYAVDQMAWSATHLITSLNGEYDARIATTHGSAIAGLPTTLTDTPFIIDHIDPRSQLDSMYSIVTTGLKYGEAIAFRRADAMVYVYDGEADGIDTPTKQTTLGVDYKRFQTVSHQHIIDDWLASENVPEEFAVYIGGFEPRYNIGTLLAAARIAQIPLVLAGDGSQRDSVEQFTETSDTITYLGTVEHELIPALLDAASAGVCLVDDPHTVKILEYGAAGLPVVHLDGQARKKLPEEGIVWTDNNIPSVARALDTVLTNQPKTDAFERYAQERTWESVVDDYEQVIQNVQA